MHVVAVIRAAGVVVDEPGVDLGAELAESIEASSVKRGSPTFLQRGALEPFAHRVVVRGPRWGAVMGDLEFGEMGIEGGTELGSVVGEHAGDGHAEASEFGDDTVEEPFRDVGVGWAEEHFADRPSGGGVDRGELPDLPDPFEVPDVEAVEGDEVTGTSREVAEPERSLPCVEAHYCSEPGQGQAAGRQIVAARSSAGVKCAWFRGNDLLAYMGHSNGKV